MEQTLGVIDGFYRQNIPQPIVAKNATFLQCFTHSNFNDRYLIYGNMSEYAQNFNNYTAYIYRTYELIKRPPLDKFEFTEYFIQELETINSPYNAFDNYPDLKDDTTHLNDILNYITDSRSLIPLQVINNCNLTNLKLNEFYLSSDKCTYGYDRSIVSDANVKDLAGNLRLCLLIQNVKPDVS